MSLYILSGLGQYILRPKSSRHDAWPTVQANVTVADSVVPRQSILSRQSFDRGHFRSFCSVFEDEILLLSKHPSKGDRTEQGL